MHSHVVGTSWKDTTSQLGDSRAGERTNTDIVYSLVPATVLQVAQDSGEDFGGPLKLFWLPLGLES